MDELEVVRKNLRERMNSLADTLASGSCRSFEEYKHLCGCIEGLAYAERDILDMQEKNRQE